MTNTEFVESVAENLSLDRLNIVLGWNSPDQYHVEQETRRKRDITPWSHPIFSTHPLELEEEFEKLIARQQASEGERPFVVFTNWFSAHKELQTAGHTGHVDLRWIVCDDGVEVYDRPAMPPSSVLNHMEDLIDRDRRAVS